MDLLTQLKTLKENTQNPEVVLFCENSIKEIQQGHNSLNEELLFQQVESLQNAQQSMEKNPLDLIREQQMTTSKTAASKILESWGGVDSRTFKSSGSYVDGIEEKQPISHQNIQEGISSFATQDASVASLMKSQEVHNLGILESLLNLKDSGIFEHPSVKILAEKYYNLLKVKNLPEFIVAESYIAELGNFNWDQDVKRMYEGISNRIADLRPEIEVAKALYAISQNGSSDFYSPVTESLNKWLVSENKSITLLSQEISRWQFNPIVKNLLNNLSLMESTSRQLHVPVSSGNSEVSKVYSPVFVQGGKTLFVLGKNVFEANSTGITKLRNGQIASLPNSYLSLLESYANLNTKADANGLSIYLGKTRIVLVEENEKTSVYFGNKKLNFSDYNQFARILSIEMSKTLGVNENRIIRDIINIYENFGNIVELDFAKTISSKLYEGASVHLMKWDGKIYLNKINESMREDSFYVVNGNQATSMVKEFLKYDISEGLTEFLDGENRIKSVMMNDRKVLMENIALVEGEIQKVQNQMAKSPLFANSQELLGAKNLLERELGILRQKWSVVNEEIKKIESSPDQITNMNEDADFNVGEYVKVKESGNTGKIVSINGSSGSYTVLMDNGRTGEFRLDEIINLDDALASAGEDNEAEAETEEELKEGTQPLASAPGKSAKAGKLDKSVSATMRKSTTKAPAASHQDAAGKKDVEDLDDANLEEAPAGQKLTKYRAFKKAGYNLAESRGAGQSSSSASETSWESAKAKEMNLAVAPGEADHTASNFYKTKVTQGTSKNPELMKTDPNYAAAPGTKGVGKELKYRVSSEMGYNVDEMAEIEKTNQELAKAPGPIATYGKKFGAKTVHGKKGSPEVMKIDPNFANAPGMNSKGHVDYDLNDEMGYNLDESEESKKN
ncbi:hypothetical protein EBU91_01565 [bacterium]|nr:hypothetical protein [bacterium]